MKAPPIFRVLSHPCRHVIISILSEEQTATQNTYSPPQTNFIYLD